MRTKFFNVIIALLLAMGSCETVYYYQYIVENQTDHLIRIEGYHRFDIGYSKDGIIKTRNENLLSTVEIITIKPHSKYSVFKGLGFHSEPQGIFNNANIDSVNIIFNSQKILVQYCNEESLRYCDIERNIMGIESEYVRRKIGRSSGEKEYSFIYTITEADYNNALPIGAD